jgi:hypothetical protein
VPREPFHAAHRPQPGIQAPVIGFDGVIRVLLGDVTRGGEQLLDHSRVGRCPVGGHLARAPAVIEGADEESAGGSQIRFSDTNTSMTWPYWSIARYRYTHRPATLT